MPTATFQAVVTDEHGASSAAVDIVVNLIGVNDIAEATDDESSVTEDSGSYTLGGTVAVAETRLPGLADHSVIRASQFGLLGSREAVALALRFFDTGRFRRADAAASAPAPAGGIG